MQLPELANWIDTRLGLHSAAQVVGGIRTVAAPPEPNWTHLGLQTVPEGLTTGSLPQAGTFTLHFADTAVLYQPPQGSLITIPLANHTQMSLADRIDEVLASVGTSIKLDRKKVSSSAPLKVDSALAADYAQVLNWVTTALTKFRETLLGERSKLVVWPHGFDTSFLWFATSEASESAPHMAFGFSPGSAGLDRPYFYAYAHPVPAGLLDTPLVPPAHWHNKGWTGMVLDYDALITAGNPDQTIESAFRSLYDSVRFS